MLTTAELSAIPEVADIATASANTLSLLQSLGGQVPVVYNVADASAYLHNGTAFVKYTGAPTLAEIRSLPAVKDCTSLTPVEALAYTVNTRKRLVFDRASATVKIFSAGTFTAAPVASTGGSGGGTSSAAYQAFSVSPTFTAFPLVMAQYQLTGPVTVTVNQAGALPGASVLMRMVADGVAINAPVFVGCTQGTGSSGWDNRAGAVNLVQMQFDGTTYWFSIMQATGGSVIDLQPPALLTSTINPAGNAVTLTYNEALLPTSLPAGAMFTGATVTAASITGAVVTLTLNPVIASGASIALTYAGSGIKDLAGNAAPGFTTATMTVTAAAPVPIPMALQSRDAGFTEVAVGTYRTTSGGSWIGGVSTSLNFVGDAIYETTDTSLTPSQGIIGLHPTAVTIGALGSYNGMHVGIAYYGGAVNILQQGAQVNYGAWVAGTNMRIKRTGSVFIAQKKVGAGAWTTFHTYSYAFAGPMSASMILNDNLNTMSAGVY